MSSLARGLAALDVSFDVFRRQPRLVVLPAASLFVVGTAYGALAVALLHYDLLGALFTSRLVQYAALWAGLAIASVTGIFFNAAVVDCAIRTFEGETPSLRSALGRTWAIRYELLKWGLLAATVGAVLYILEDNVPGVGSLTSALFNIAWALLTFFIVPVLVVERTGVLDGLHRSGTVFTETWGESVTASLGIGIISLPPILLGGGLLWYAYFFATGPAAPLMGVIGGALLVVSVVILQVVGQVVRAALYLHATTEREIDGPDGFDAGTWIEA